MDNLQASKCPEVATTSIKPSSTAADRPAYFFTNGFANPELPSILQFPAKPMARPAIVHGFKLCCMEGHDVIVDGAPHDFVSGVAHQIRDEYDISDLRTFSHAKFDGLVMTTVTVQCIDNMTEVLALMSHWMSNTIQKPQDDRSLAKEANMLQFPDHIRGRSSALANIQFGQFKPPGLKRETIPLTAPKIIIYSPPDSPPVSEPASPPISKPASPLVPPPLTIGHEKPQTLFPRPFLLYGSQENPWEIVRLLGLDSLPSMHRGCVKGYRKMLFYGKQAVVYGSKDDVVRGVVYMVQTREDAQRLRPGRDFRAFHCGIRPDEAPPDGHPQKISECSQNGAIFRWVGDQSQLKIMVQVDGDMCEQD